MTKIGRIAVEAYKRATAGQAPPEAWREALSAVYSDRQLENQLKHTCPKWAFSGLCQEGELRGIAAGSSPPATDRQSAKFAREALNVLRREPELAEDKAALKRRVFGMRGEEGFRTPNGEVEVVLALWEAGLMQGAAQGADGGPRGEFD